MSFLLCDNTVVALRMLVVRLWPCSRLECVGEFLCSRLGCVERILQYLMSITVYLITCGYAITVCNTITVYGIPNNRAGTQ